MITLWPGKVHTYVYDSPFFSEAVENFTLVDSPPPIIFVAAMAKGTVPLGAVPDIRDFVFRVEEVEASGKPTVVFER